MFDSNTRIATSTTSLSVMLCRLWYHLSRRRKIQFGLLCLLSVFASLMEVFSLGILLPFLGILVSPENIFQNERAQIVIQFLGIRSANELILPMTLLFIFAISVASCFRLLLIWASTRLSFAAGSDLSVDIYNRTLYQPYSKHIACNSSEAITAVTARSYHLIHNAILPALTIFSSIILIVMIVSALVAVKPLVAILTFAGFATIYLWVARLSRSRLKKDSEIIARESTTILRLLQDGLGGIRDVIIDGTQALYCNAYRVSAMSLRSAEGRCTFIMLSPRLVVEALGMMLIATLAYQLSKQSGSLIDAIPVLGMLAMGAQRLMPVLQQIYGAWVSIRSQSSSVMIALDFLERPLPAHAHQIMPPPLPFNEKLHIQGVSFCYAHGDKSVLKHINLSIGRGERVGFIGKTGSGKSTLLDIVMGLLRPTQGQIVVDDIVLDETNIRAWQANIAHVPQTIFLADYSVEENIAFGVAPQDIDHERVRQVAQLAQLSDVIEALPQGYKTSVGERGVRLSGGQRQRIGIARAFYKRASVIIFDEATSALDNVTETELMAEVQAFDPNMTILMIAHRLTTLANCNLIVELERGQITRVGSYAEIVQGAKK
jgi:ABC-type multidrug transport system fused ATPase/permease subunit